MLGGAVGNALDRLLRGYVIDFIDWHWFDPTWGTMYVSPKAAQSNVLSLVNVLRLPSAEQRTDRIGDGPGARSF